MRLTIAILLFSLTANASTFFIDYSTGADSNNGTSKSTPWLRHPYMRGFSGVYSHTAGDRFIFRGGVTWPSTCFPMQIATGGNSGARDWYGADTTWYTGGSFVRPLFDFRSTILPWPSSGVYFTAGYITFGDWMDLANHRAAASSYGPMTISIYGANYVVITNAVIRDWNMATPVANSTDAGGGVGFFPSGGGGNGLEVTHCSLNQLMSPTIGGTAVYGIPFLNWSEIWHCGNVYHGGGIIHDNSMHDILDGTDPYQHQDVMAIYSQSQIYNNLVCRLQSSRTAPIQLNAPSAGWLHGDDLVYNNILFRVAGQGPIYTKPDSGNYADYGLIAFNNVIEQVVMGVGPCIMVERVGGNTFGRLRCQTNTFITPFASPGPIGYDPPNYAHVTTVTTNANTTYLSVAAANAAGLNEGNNYNPSGTHGPQGTVGAAGVVTPTPPEPPPAYGTLQLEGDTFNVAEAGPAVNIRVTRLNGSYGVVSVNYATANGSAVAGHDYTATSGTAYFANGSTNSVTITVPITDSDDTALTNRAFTLSLSGVSGGATLGSPASATINVVMNPPSVPVVAYPTWSATNALVTPSVTVEADYITNSVWYSGLAQYNVTFPTFGDYYFTAEVNAFGLGNNSWYFDIDNDPRMNDQRAWDVTSLTTSFESRVIGWRGTGTFTTPQFTTNYWSLSAGTHTIWVGGREPGALKSFTAHLVVPAPPPPTPPEPPPPPVPPPPIIYAFLSTNGILSTTAPGAVTAIVTRVVNTAIASTVDYTTVPGTALPGRNYTTKSGTLTFAPGDLTSNVVITILDDPVYRGVLTFGFQLQNPDANTTLSAPTNLTVTLTPATSPAYIQFQDAGLSSVTLTQTLVAVVNRTVNVSGTSTVHYETVNGTAYANRNYTATSGTLTFAPGVGVQLIPLTVWTDPVYRGNISFYLHLSSPDPSSVISEPTDLLITLAPGVTGPNVIFRNVKLYNVHVP